MMTDFTPKWHRELEIFSRIKPLIMLEGNVFDSYQFPYEGSVPQGSILRLTDYLHYFFRDKGYANIAFYDSLRGFYNSCEDGYTHRFADLVGASEQNGAIAASFKGGNDGGAAQLTRRALSQNKESCVVIMTFASRCIPSPDRLQQS